MLMEAVDALSPTLSKIHDDHYFTAFADSVSNPNSRVLLLGAALAIVITVGALILMQFSRREAQVRKAVWWSAASGAAALILLVAALSD